MVPTIGLRLRNRVRERRRALGLTVAEMARQAGVSRRVAGLVDRGTNHVPSGTVQLKLAQALETTVQDLFYSEPVRVAS